jgi:hypothetical protein
VLRKGSYASRKWDLSVPRRAPWQMACEAVNMSEFLHTPWPHDEHGDIGEYVVVLAVILALVIGTVQLFGTGSNNVFPGTAGTQVDRTPRGHM